MIGLLACRHPSADSTHYMIELFRDGEILRACHRSDAILICEKCQKTDAIALTYDLEGEKNWACLDCRQPDKQLADLVSSRYERMS